MFLNFLKAVKVVRSSPATAAGGSDTITGTTVDGAGFDSACVVAELGPAVDAGVATLRVQDGAVANGSDAANITGASAVLTASTSSNTQIIVDVQKFQARYITPTLQRATQNFTVNSITVYLYNAKSLPVTQPASVSASTEVLAAS